MAPGSLSSPRFLFLRERLLAVPLADQFNKGGHYVTHVDVELSLLGMEQRIQCRFDTIRSNILTTQLSSDVQEDSLARRIYFVERYKRYERVA